MADIIELHPSLRKLVGLEPTVQQIATGLGFTEGPVWDARRKRLIFSDIPGNTVYQWTEQNGHTVLRQPSNNTNGNTIDLQGRLVSCEHSGRRVSRLDDGGGGLTVLASHFEGKQLNSPNDVICSTQAEIIFTDPPYGLKQPDGSFAKGELDFSGVYRLSGDGNLSLLVADFVRPNGLLLDASERRLFICDTHNHHVRVFDMAGDGILSNGTVFAMLNYEETQGRPDGIKTDTQGNIYVAGGTKEGVWVFNPEGALIGLIGVGENPANLAWGGDDWRTLFVTARTSVYRIELTVAGQPVGGEAIR